MRALRFLIRNSGYLYIASIALFLVASMWGVQTIENLSEYDPIIYMNLASQLLWWAFVLSLVGIVISSILIAIESKRVSLGVNAILASLLFIVIGGFFAYASQDTLLNQDEFRHITSIRSDNHTYNLAYYFPSYHGQGTLTYIVYECDSLNILCHIIYRDAGRDFKWWERMFEPETDREKPPFNAKLLVDNASTISLELEGEVVYTHQVEG